MWHTQHGDRVLRGAEAKAFAQSLLDLAQFGVSADGDSCTGIPVFDSLTCPQKIAVLYQVAHALFRESVPMPELTAVLEGAAGAVIENLRMLVEEEVQADPDGEGPLRRLVTMACRDLRVEEMPHPSSRSIEDWEFCVECLHDAILWDSDYLGESLFTDLPPERSRTLKENMGVSDEYFLAVAPDPASEQAATLLAGLLSLCQEVTQEGHPKTSTVRKPRRPPG